MSICTLRFSSETKIVVSFAYSKNKHLSNFSSGRSVFKSQLWIIKKILLHYLVKKIEKVWWKSTFFPTDSKFGLLKFFGTEPLLGMFGNWEKNKIDHTKDCWNILPKCEVSIGTNDHFKENTLGQGILLSFHVRFSARQNYLKEAKYDRNLLYISEKYCFNMCFRTNRQNLITY